MSKTKDKKVLPKKASKPIANNKNNNNKPVEPKPNKNDDGNFEPDSSEDPYDFVIDALEKQVTASQIEPKLKISDYIDDEAEEARPKKKAKSTLPNKSWSPAEAALLKLLIVGCPPLGRNSSGIIIL